MARVNTFILGAQKAGTTSLYDWLGQHPQVNAPKELKDFHFFTDPDFKEKSHEEYESLFKSDEKEIQINAAVNYLYFHQIVAERIYHYNSEAKFIICLRNPIDRAISAYKFFVRTNKENASFEKALLRELNGEIEVRNKSDFTYLAHGLYVDQIKGYLKFFDRSQIHFLVFEKLINPETREVNMIELCNFLNINLDHQFEFNHLNKSGKPKSEIINKLIKEDYFLKSLKNIIPFSFRKKLGRKIDELNISNKRIEVKITDDRMNFLIKYFERSVKELESIVDLDLQNTWSYDSK